MAALAGMSISLPMRKLASGRVALKAKAPARVSAMAGPRPVVSGVSSKVKFATRGPAPFRAISTTTSEDALERELQQIKEAAMVKEAALVQEAMKAKDEAEDMSGPPHKVTPTIVTKIANDAVGAANALGPLFLKAILAGVFIGLGGVLCSSVGGDAPALAASDPGLQRGIFGALGFPLSIFLVTTLGASAMTGMIVMVTCAYLQGRMTSDTALRTLTVAWFGNAVGLCSIAALAAAGNMDAVIPCAAISLHKAAASWWQVFFRGVGGAILICSAIMQAYAARNGVEKLLGIWFCISTYVMCGWEHGLANLLFFPCAIFGGAEGITWGMFIEKNLIPSTLGNMVGGILLGVAMSFIHLPGKVNLPKISVEYEGK